MQDLNRLVWLVSLLTALSVSAGACTTKPGQMFNGRVAAPTSFDRECGYAWQMWKKHLGPDSSKLRWVEMWSAKATDNVAPQDLQDLVTKLGYTKTKKVFHNSDAVFKGSEIYFDGPKNSFLLIELFFVGDRMNVLLGGD